MKPGDTVYWRAVNGVVSGTLDEKAGDGYWYVTLPNGRSMLVKESNFKNNGK